MNDHNQCIDRLCLFLSTEFFSEYWRLLGSHVIETPARKAIQTLARAVVRGFMEEEDCYWDIEFSSARHERSSDLFHRGAAGLAAPDVKGLAEIEASFCQSDRQQSGTTFTLSLLHRIAADGEFALRIGLSPADRDLVASSLPSNDELTLDTYHLEQEWLRSTSVWDTEIRNLTPDLPEYVANSFSAAYEFVAELPAFLKGVELLLDPGEAVAFTERLCAVIEGQFPEVSGLLLPRCLTNSLLAERTDLESP